MLLVSEFFGVFANISMNKSDPDVKLTPIDSSCDGDQERWKFVESAKPRDLIIFLEKNSYIEVNNIWFDAARGAHFKYAMLSFSIVP